MPCDVHHTVPAPGRQEHVAPQRTYVELAVGKAQPLGEEQLNKERSEAVVL